MRQTITRNDENSRILNTLIINGFYTGYVGPEKIELIRNHFPNNHRIIGVLNDSGNYDLKLDFISPINMAWKTLIALGILATIIFLVKGNWILPILLVFFGLIIYVGFKLKEKKELNLLTDKLLEFHKVKL